MVEHIYAVPVEITDEQTGEVKKTIRTCVICVNGQVYSSSSMWIAKAIQRLRRSHGNPPWKYGIPVVAKLMGKDAQRQWLTLVNSPPEVQTKGKK
jgi:hypothetical protein